MFSPPSSCPVFSSALLQLFQAHPEALPPHPKAKTIEALALFLLLSSRSARTWKYQPKVATATYQRLNTPSLWFGLQGGIFLACLSNFVLQVVTKPTPHAKSEWNRWLLFARSFGIPILAAESPLAIELMRLIAQGASKLNPKPPLQKFVPLTPEQFFYLITSLTPKDRKASLPQRQADATSTSIIALMLTAARGFRFGELGPRDCLAIYRSYTAEELFKIPRVDDLVFYTQSGPCVLGSLPSVQAQRRLLCAMQSDPHARIAFRCKKTKPGRPRFVLLIHVHPFGSAVICTKCAILKSLRNRLSIQNAPLLNRDFLFSFPYKH